MDRTDMKDMFLDAIGGTSLEDDTIEQMLTDALMLLDQITARIGIDFLTDTPLLVLKSMQYYYDLLQHNYPAVNDELKQIQFQAMQLHHDYVQIEQADWPNYMGDRG